MLKSWRLLPLFLFSTLLAGCGAASPQESLVLWHSWGGSELTALKASLRAYQKQHPEIEVVALQVPSDRLQDKYVRSSAANGGPDLLIGNTDWIGKFCQSGVIDPLDNVFEQAFLERFQPISLETLHYQGHLYAIPESLETAALFYNKALMPTPPRTIDELFRRAKNGPSVAIAFNTQFFYAAGYMFGFGGRLMNEQGLIEVASPGSARWLRFLSQMNKNPKMVAKSDYGKADALFRERKAACTVNGPWALKDYQAALGKDLGVAMLPRVGTKNAAPFVGIKCFMFNPNSSKKNRAMALEFTRFFTEKENMERMLKEAGHIPAVKTVTPVKGSPLSFFAQQALVGTPLPAGPEMREVWTPMDRVIEEVYSNAKSPEKALSDAQALIRARVDEVKKQ